MRSHGRLPDLFIAEPKGGYCGLFIEIKAESIFNKNGTRKTSTHLKEQSNMLDKLTNKGYCAVFGCGWDECKKIIDNYLK